MKSDKSINICFLEEFPSVQEGIFSLCGISKNQLKKFKFSKKFLDKKINSKDEISFPINLINNGKINPEFEGEQLKVLSEDNDVIALYKPNKIHMHPLSYDEKNNCLSFLSSIGRNELLKINEDDYDRSLLYRLDFETSGLVLLGKNQSSFRSLRDNFKEAAIEKKYLAIVSGEFKHKGRITHFLKGSGKKGSIVKASTESFDQSSLAECEVSLQEFDPKRNLSLVAVKLKQGHRHQIRVQLAELGFPIVGDRLYGGDESFGDQMFLHCYKYILNISGDEREYICEEGLIYSFFFNSNS